MFQMRISDAHSVLQIKVLPQRSSCQHGIDWCSVSGLKLPMDLGPSLPVANHCCKPSGAVEKQDSALELAATVQHSGCLTSPTTSIGSAAGAPDAKSAYSCGMSESRPASKLFGLKSQPLAHLAYTGCPCPVTPPQGSKAQQQGGRHASSSGRWLSGCFLPKKQYNFFNRAQDQQSTKITGGCGKPKSALQWHLATLWLRFFSAIWRACESRGQRLGFVSW